MTRSIEDARLIYHQMGPAAWNMAVDEMLLRRAEASRSVTLRIYAWSQPTLSLGYFQNAGDRAGHAASLRCPVVRRSTGGGAIVHDAELTYSLVIPPSLRGNADHQSYYRTCHHALIKGLGDQGVTAHRCDAIDLNRTDRFLCFERRSAGDVLIGEHKIGGSAQRQHRRSLLQHGTFLWRSSPAAPEIPGVQDLASGPVDINQVISAWLDDLADQFLVRWTECALAGPEIAEAREIARAKYASEKWTLRR